MFVVVFVVILWWCLFVLLGFFVCLFVCLFRGCCVLLLLFVGVFCGFLCGGFVGWMRQYYYDGHHILFQSLNILIYPSKDFLKTKNFSDIPELTQLLLLLFVSDNQRYFILTNKLIKNQERDVALW